jgi:hypothetical protein
VNDADAERIRTKDRAGKRMLAGRPFEMKDL